MNFKIISKTVAFLCAVFLYSAIFCSCESTVTIKVSGNKTWFSFSAEGGEKFIKTLKMLDSSESFGSEDSASGAGNTSYSGSNGGNTNTGSSGGPELFNSAVIQENFTAAGFKDVRAEKIGNKGFSVTFSSPENAKNPLTESGILNYSELKKPYFSLSREKFQQFYDKIPFELKSYIDLFMAPSFTDEEMDNEEYLDLVASVFGPGLSDEIKNARIHFVFDDNGKISRKTMSLLSILNIEGKLTIGM